MSPPPRVPLFMAGQVRGRSRVPTVKNRIRGNWVHPPCNGDLKGKQRTQNPRITHLCGQFNAHTMFRSNFYEVAVDIVLFIVTVSWTSTVALAAECRRSGGGKLHFTWGDAFEGTDCTGPNGLVYPTQAINSIVHTYKGSLRQGRSMHDPYNVRNKLLKAWEVANERQNELERRQRAPTNSRRTCQTPLGRLCRTTYNTTAPLYGISLTSGEPVTIVQKFPDLLQQVVFETCTSNECDVIHGRCTQTYVPYLFLVVPLGPVTLTGQDYVMVESGCVCKPKHSQET